MSSVLKQLATEEVAGVFETLEIAPFASFPPHKDYMPMSPVAKLLFRVVPYQERVLSGRVSLQDRPLKGIGAQVVRRKLSRHKILTPFLLFLLVEIFSVASAAGSLIRSPLNP